MEINASQVNLQKLRDAKEVNDALEANDPNSMLTREERLLNAVKLKKDSKSGSHSLASDLVDSSLSGEEQETEWTNLANAFKRVAWYLLWESEGADNYRKTREHFDAMMSIVEECHFHVYKCTIESVISELKAEVKSSLLEKELRMIQMLSGTLTEAERDVIRNPDRLQWKYILDGDDGIRPEIRNLFVSSILPEVYEHMTETYSLMTPIDDYDDDYVFSVEEIYHIAFGNDN